MALGVLWAGLEASALGSPGCSLGLGRGWGACISGAVCAFGKDSARPKVHGLRGQAVSPLRWFVT